MIENYVCMPLDINVKAHFYDSFGDRDTEISAGWIVLFCQHRDEEWEPFTYEDINDFYKSKGRNDGFWFNNLLPGMFIIKKEDKYIITPKFVQLCFKSSPAK